MSNIEQIGFPSLKEKRKSNLKNNKSTPHSIYDAAAVVKSYHDSTNIGGVRKPVVLKIPDGQPIDGFYFKFEKGLLEMLNRKDVMGMYLALGNIESKGQTIMIYGVTAENRNTDDTDANGNRLKLLIENKMIFDLCDPCPDRCPVNLNLTPEKT